MIFVVIVVVVSTSAAQIIYQVGEIFTTCASTRYLLFLYGHHPNKEWKIGDDNESTSFETSVFFYTGYYLSLIETQTEMRTSVADCM